MTQPGPAAPARRDWFYWTIAAFTGLQLLWAAAVAVDFALHPWAPDLDLRSPLDRLMTVVVIVPLTAGIALLVLRRTRGNVVGLCLLLWSTSIMAGALRAGSPLVAYNALNTGWIGLWLLPLFFPDGLPRPRRLGGLIRGLSALLVVSAPVSLLFAADQSSGGRRDLANGLFVPALGRFSPILGGILDAALLATLLLIVPSLVARYRSSDARMRQQMKWLAWSFGMILVVVPVAAQFGLFSNVPVQLSPTLQLADSLLGLAVTLAPSLAVGHAILRHRLYDIDVIIRRTVIYSVLTGLLTLTYFGCVLVLQSVVKTVTGEGQNQLVIVLSTLASAVLFVPLRGWVQAFIDRRFYRRKYDAAHTLAAFAAGARDEVDLEHLSGRLVEAVDQSMQPAHVSLWIK